MQAVTPAAAAQTADVVKALAPLFAAGFAIQQLTDLLDSGLSSVFAPKGLGDAKKFILKMLAVAGGVVFVLTAQVSVLTPLAPGTNVPTWLDHAIAALIVGGGTEGMNSIVKFLGYAKEDKKAEAGKKQGAATASEQAGMAKVALK